jgi:hypothetical protein
MASARLGHLSCSKSENVILAVAVLKLERSGTVMVATDNKREITSAFRVGVRETLQVGRC